MMNNAKSYDMVQQMYFRCMTEGKNKKCGFVIEFDIRRITNISLANYASIVKPELHPRDSIKYIVQSKLINLNPDHWMSCFPDGNSKKLTELSKSLYDIYASNTLNALEECLHRMKLKEIILSTDEQQIIDNMFSNVKLNDKKQEQVNTALNADESDNEEKINKGLEKQKVEESDVELDVEEKCEETKKNTKDKKVKNVINYMSVLKHMTPLICLLTIRNTETTFLSMFESIEKDKILYEILLNQTKSWWGCNINDKVIKKFIKIYTKYLSSDQEYNQIIRTVKELFLSNINNAGQLSILIDKYFIPQELEKKANAEVSTPHKLRQQMLDKLPVKFWTKPNKVFEPCCGKGGFIVDIINKFKNGLEDLIPDENEKYRIIVEDCLYFSDINITNIFICQLLIDPNNMYKLNFNEGDTLKLDIKEKWKLDGFNAVIGNPPYNSPGKVKTGNTIWQHFTEKALKEWLVKKGYLVFVHPPSWRKPCTEKGRNHGFYDLMVKTNYMSYLSIHNMKDGLKVFKCGTRYDWYVIQKITNTKESIISDENHKEISLDLREFNWLPNSNIDLVQEQLALKDDEKCEVLFSSNTYDQRKKYMSRIKTEEFKYPCIHSTCKEEPIYLYSSVNDKGFFGISKVIFGDSSLDHPIIDMEGKYGMTAHAIAIVVKSKKEAKLLVNCLKSEKFDALLKSCLFSQFQIDRNIFESFKKKFYMNFQ